MLNYLRVTIKKIKLINDINIQSYNLKIELFKQIHEIQKLSNKENEINKVLKYFLNSSRVFFWTFQQI